MCVCVRVCEYICSCVHGMWKSEDTLWGLCFSFYHVGHRDQIQAVRLSCRYLYLLSHLASPLKSDRKTDANEKHENFKVISDLFLLSLSLLLSLRLVRSTATALSLFMKETIIGSDKEQAGMSKPTILRVCSLNHARQEPCFQWNVGLIAPRLLLSGY